MKNSDLFNEIEKFSSNSLTRMISRLNIPLFDKDAAREHKYRMSVLNGLVDVKKSLDNFHLNILGSSGESIFKSMQYLSSANRQIDNLTSTLNTYLLEKQKKETEESFKSQEDLNDDYIVKIIDDFNLNKLNFDFNESVYFEELQSIIEKYKSGNLFLKEPLIEVYQKLINDLSDEHDDTLGDIFHQRIRVASFAGNAKKWFGTIFHNLSLFDKTSAMRLDAAKKAKESLSILNKEIDKVEKDLDIVDLFDVLTELKLIIDSIKIIIKPLLEFIKGMTYGDEFIKMLEKDKLTEFPVDMSDKQKKTFENYLNRRNYKDLSNLYNT